MVCFVHERRSGRRDVLRLFLVVARAHALLVGDRLADLQPVESAACHLGAVEEEVRPVRLRDEAVPAIGEGLDGAVHFELRSSLETRSAHSSPVRYSPSAGGCGLARRWHIVCLSWRRERGRLLRLLPAPSPLRDPRLPPGPAAGRRARPAPPPPTRRA